MDRQPEFAENRFVCSTDKEQTIFFILFVNPIYRAEMLIYVTRSIG